ncbi:hypothetical protein HGB07_01300 [Candidatus Roizmanbacteria bacterium]|nr:hypothetical protein [Candidatus Roizmanbacteria bacterium]
MIVFRKLSLVLFVVFFFVPVHTACAKDGSYEAEVTTPSGTYSVEVEVVDGEVAFVQWPNGGDMNVYGAEVINGEAYGTNSRGEFIEIEIEDPSYEKETDMDIDSEE